MAQDRSFFVLVQAFAAVFTAPSFNNFSFLLVSWIQTRVPRTIAGLLRNAPHRGPKHFSVFHRFFARAQWSMDGLGQVLVELLRDRLGTTATLIVDDTLCRRSGPRIIGAGMHYDPLASHKRGRKHTAFAFGLNFVVLAVWIPVSFCHSGGIAIPVLFRLYRSKRTCPQALYTKRTRLAAELIRIAAPWFDGKRVTVLGDSEYACQTVLMALPEGVDFCGPLPMNARLHDRVLQRSKRGRPRQWGKRLPSPQALKQNESWQTGIFAIYGAPVRIQFVSVQAMWASSGPRRLLRIVITRDPSGRLKDAAFFHTRADATPSEVITTYSRRWELEVTFRNCKQQLGLEDPANGFARRKRRDKKHAGPYPLRGRQPIASARTAPFSFIVHAIVVIWYVRCGRPNQDIKLARRLAPWYRHKSTISFTDMLESLRRQLDKNDFPRTRRVFRSAKKPLTQRARPMACKTAA
jgi:hypothetical protein